MLPSKEAKDRIFDFFLPAGIEAPKDIQPYHYLAALAVVVVPSLAFFGVQYALLGVTVGAVSLFVAAAIILLLPFYLRITGRREVTMAVGLITLMVTLSILTLTKGHFTLSTIMWLGLMPIAANFAIGQRWMWISAGLSALFATTCYVLPKAGIVLGGFPENPALRSRIEFMSWCVFLVVSTMIAFAFSRARERAQRDQESLDQLLERSRRMHAVGELAGGVAHEFNNLLTIILGNADLAKTLGNLDEDTEQSIDDILHAAQRGSEITRELLLFSRSEQQEVRGAIDASDSVSAALRFLKPTLGEQIQIEAQIADDLPLAGVSRRAIEQTVINLALNARDAMGSEGGTLNVGLREIFVDSKRALELDMEPGSWLRLTVSDTGSGMDKETLDRIFEPFFTTKSGDKGTGLGLAVVFGLVRAAGGSIHVASTIGLGTRFDVYLPLAEEEEQSADVENVEPTKGGRGHILVVEDQPAVRKLACRILTEAGYDVDEAADGNQGLETLTTATRPYDLVVTDVRMPRMGGVQMATEIRQRQSETPILFVSGYLGADSEEDLIRELACELLPKPFSPGALLEAVHRNLQGQPKLDLSATPLSTTSKNRILRNTDLN